MNPAVEDKELRKLIEEAKAQQRTAQHRLFQLYSAKMLSICRYYIADLHYAEDVMISGFHKALMHLHTYRGEGSFEGWIKTIIMREAISYLRKNKPVLFVNEDCAVPEEDAGLDEVMEKCDSNLLQQLIDDLPQGYKTVFLLYVLQEYSHKQIAALLHISESTSKTQLFKAKNMLRKNFETFKKKKNGSE